MDKLLYGAAYYEEYMPYDRLEKDVAMMKKAGINAVRIAESTWSTCEPQEGVFDFSHVERVLDAMEQAGIGVIIGTPTYAVPTWMVKSYPEILATTINGRGIYGPRQIMDITHPAYRFYCERVIRKLMEVSAHRKCVIGFQLDNETKPYGTAGQNVQERFVKYLREKFHDDLDALNAAFGLDYWSNRVNAWEDFPDVRGTINGSLGAEFGKFQRSLVTDFLSWQAGIVRQYAREDQFITHDFDYDWRGYSYGVQPAVDQLQAARCLSIVSANIYHPTQDYLTGTEIAFGGDLIRSLKGGNYLILETEAQGFPEWTPYKGQLRLQAYSHIASGANSVMYWHWHSIHNSLETYWKGLLSHDLEENETYREACTVGREFRELSGHLVNLKKKNEVAILVSNEAQTALKWFPIGNAPDGSPIQYNDVVRWMYDTLYQRNVECDFVWPESENLEDYKVILVPALYAASDRLLQRLNRYVEQGGQLVATFKSAFANEHVKVSHDMQPHILRDCMGVRYQQFARPNKVGLVGGVTGEAQVFMELLIPEGAQVLARYDHYNWKDYAAITKNSYGSGHGYYLGCMTGQEQLSAVLKDALTEAGLEMQEAPTGVIVRKGVNGYGKTVRFYLNYSGQARSEVYRHEDGVDLITKEAIRTGEAFVIAPWDLRVVEAQERGTE